MNLDIEKEHGSDNVINRLQALNISSFGHTFDNYKVNEKIKGNVEILKSISTGKSEKQFALVYGATGCGKTHLIEAMIISWVSQGIAARYLTFSEIARMLKMRLRQGGEYYEKQFNIYRDAGILVIDDFGMGTTESRFEVSDLEDIIDSRYRRRYYPGNNLVTVLATNKDIKDLPERITSRFYDPEIGVVLYMGDKDYRKRLVK